MAVSTPGPPIAPATAAVSAASALVVINEPVVPGGAAGVSGALCAITFAQGVVPAAAAQSAASLAVTAPSVMTPAAGAASSASLTVKANTQIGAASAGAQSAASCLVTTPQPFTASAAATSTATCLARVTFQKVQLGNPFTYPAWDAVTVTELDDLPYTNVQFGRIVNTPGPFAGNVQLSDPGVQKLKYLASSVPGRTLVGVEFLGGLVWLGMIWTRKYTRKGTNMLIGAQELGSWLAQRVQAADYTSTWADGADPMVIAQQMVADMLAVGTICGTWTSVLNPASTTSPAQAQSYPANGTYSWTCPPGVTSISVVATGAGGGAGGASSAQYPGGGGGGGESAGNTALTVVPGDVYTIVVGAGGAGGGSNANGVAGGNTTFALGGTTLITANGGAGGVKGGSASGGAGGSPGSGSTNPWHWPGGYGGGGGGHRQCGGGGGSSAGLSAAGNNGGVGGLGSGLGGAAPYGGCPGGNGDNGSGPQCPRGAAGGGGGGGSTINGGAPGAPGPDGALAISYVATNPGSGQSLIVSYPITQMQTIMALLTLLVQMGYSYGFDYTIDTKYSPGTRTPVVTINFWWPRCGQYNPTMISIDIANATDFEYLEDATKQAWSMTEKGGGSGGIEPVTEQATQVAAAGWPLLEAVTSRAQVNTTEVLTNIAKGDLSIKAWPVTTPTVTVPIALPNTEGVLNPDALQFDQLTIGDDMQLVIDPVPLNAAGQPVYGINNDPRFPAGMNFTWRNTNWTAQIPKGGMPVFVLALAVPPAVSTNPTQPPE